MWRHEFEEALKHDPVVILPTGSVEQHGPHCPVDVDISGPFYMAVQAAQAVTEFPVIVAPPVWSGFTHYNMGFPGTLSLRLETYQNLIFDICQSIYANGFKRIVLINGHGGNISPNDAIMHSISEENIFIIAFGWWDIAREEMVRLSEADGGSEGHGGEWETSIQLYLRPHLIDHSRMVADTRPYPFSPELRSFAQLAERRRDSAKVTGTHGNPFVASAEKGEKVVYTIVQKLVQLVREYHTQPVQDYREFGTHCP
jgi:creatinine amidohydrolase